MTSRPDSDQAGVATLSQFAKLYGMNSYSDTKACCDCGTYFKKSKTDYTVRCPDCRGRKTAAPKATAYRSIECCKCGTHFTSLRCPGCGF